MRITPRYFENLKRKRKGRYVRIGKINVYYETYGTGKPLLLLHGGLSCIDGLRYQIPFFAGHFRVILPERPGHGHTADIPGSYTYERMARQTAAFMDKLKLRNARLMGYSDGANILYRLAATRPDLVERFISVGGNFHYSGCEPVFQRDLQKKKISELEIDLRYAAYSPDGAAHYPSVYEKCRKLWLTEPRWKTGLIRQIKAMALILAGDRDMIRQEHTLTLYRNLQKAQLAIVPGATHGLLKEKPGIVNAIMLEFLRQSSRASSKKFFKKKINSL